MTIGEGLRVLVFLVCGDGRRFELGLRWTRLYYEEFRDRSDDPRRYFEIRSDRFDAGTARVVLRAGLSRGRRFGERRMVGLFEATLR